MDKWSDIILIALGLAGFLIAITRGLPNLYLIGG